MKEHDFLNFYSGLEKIVMGFIMMTYLILHRAIRNFGDFLIYEQAAKLVGFLKSNTKLLFGRSFESLEKQFTSSELSDVDAVIIPGGPGLAKHMYPIVYPALKQVMKLRKPLLFLGIGASVNPTNFHRKRITIKFTESSLELLKYAEKFAPIGVRDYISRSILDNIKIKSQMNGCPAWYDLNYLKKNVLIPSKIKKIAFSVPALPIYVNQFIDLIYSIRNLFPEAELIVSFNHGISKGTSLEEYKRYSYIASKVKKVRAEVIDFSYSTKNAYIYDECDLHIGYRVHSHIYFLSHRKPSILIAEDLRGTGCGEALLTPYVNAWEVISKFDRPKFLILRKIGVKSLYKFFPSFSYTIYKVIELLLNEIENNFLRFLHIGKIIDSYFEKFMKPFIINYIP